MSKFDLCNFEFVIYSISLRFHNKEVLPELSWLWTIRFTFKCSYFIILNSVGHSSLVGLFESEPPKDCLTRPAAAYSQLILGTYISSEEHFNDQGRMSNSPTVSMTHAMKFEGAEAATFFVVSDNDFADKVCSCSGYDRSFGKPWSCLIELNQV